MNCVIKIKFPIEFESRCQKSVLVGEVILQEVSIEGWMNFEFGAGQVIFMDEPSIGHHTSVQGFSFDFGWGGEDYLME